MSSAAHAETLRATIFHTPQDPFQHPGALVAHEDGGLVIADGTIAACGDYSDIRQAHSEAPVRDLRGGVLLPGFIDTHTHFPQVRILGSLGDELLEWLRRTTLPEEAKFSDLAYARMVAEEFVRGLVMHGTTTALVFGSHFAPATAALFEAANSAGVRIASGLVLADRFLLPELHQTTKAAYEMSSGLIQRFHGKGRLLYAVTPRFALSASDAMLDVCQTLLAEHPDVLFQTHLNENVSEVAEVARLFPECSDYLEVYERYGLVGSRSVFAHSVQTTDAELTRMAERRCSVAHCPSSNASLGSGIFPLARHVAAGVHFALGTDVGAGTGFGMLKEGLQAYLMQRMARGPIPLTAEHLLYLATRAGAVALGLQERIGDFTVGRSADMVYLKAPEASPLAAVVRNSPTPNHLLSAFFTLAGAESVSEVWVEGKAVYRRCQ